jgi:outer membrane protein assembly factor BamE (lipoprotein component of BamABCDE complex)
MKQMRISISKISATLLVLVVTACAQPGVGEYRPDLKEATVLRVVRGLSQAEVITFLGEPYRRVRFDNLRATAWDYKYMDTWGYWVEFAVMIGDDGRVVNTVSRRMEVDQGSP